MPLIEDNKYLNVVAVEPNIPLDHFTINHQPSTINLISLSEALEADVVTFLVAHKEFKGLEIDSELDFCGVTNR